MYSIENATKFNWSSISGDLIPERVSHLRKYLFGKKILDAGCAGGAYVEFLSDQGMDVTGVDIHREFLQIAEEKKVSGNYIRADITNLPFPDNFFDCTYCFDVLEHVDDRKALSEIARVTSSRIILSVPHEDNDLKKFGLVFTTYQDSTHLRYYSKESLHGLCSSINPKSVNIFCEGYLPCQLIIEYFVDASKEEVDSFLENKNFFRKLKSCLETSYKFFILKLLRRISYKDVYMGLVAVIDLDKL